VLTSPALDVKRYQSDWQLQVAPLRLFAAALPMSLPVGSNPLTGICRLLLRRSQLCKFHYSMSWAGT
jgi:hypothetical protein